MQAEELAQLHVTLSMMRQIHVDEAVDFSDIDDIFKV